jgi:predicted TIM-barrel fold metal-dependent hydrolase
VGETQTIDSKPDYRFFDADEHSTPALDAYERYIDPKFRERAYNKITPRIRAKNFQVTFSDEQLSELGVHGAGAGEGAADRDIAAVVPGSLLNRLNPLKSLDAEGRREFAERYRALQPQLDEPVSRVVVMDHMNIETTVNYAGPLGIESDFESDFDGLYANLRAVNRYLHEHWAFNYRNRIFTPPFVSLVSAAHAAAELDSLLVDDPSLKLIQFSTGPAIHRSPFRPELDPFWARCNEAGINVCTHLANVTFYAKHGEEWDEPEAMLGDMDAFQWVMYYGDRPAYETAAAAILQGLFARFPNLNLLLSEQGTVWVPYIVRKMDHAFLMGRRATWGQLDKRPSDYFREHVVVAPFPEENVDRVVEVVGTQPLVFGSDFPHGEGLPEPEKYLGQLKNLSADHVRAVMRDNLANFLGLPA